MGIFNKVRKYFRDISNIESSIVVKKDEFAEMYERNKQLENEIIQRTSELKQANQTILTLQNIWDMMNSSQPLTNVLEKIITSLQGDLGYITCLILQKHTEDEEEFFKISTFYENLQIREVNLALKNPITEYKINYVKGGMLDEALTKKKITSTNDLNELLRISVPHIAEKVVDVMKEVGRSNTTIFLPLFVNEKPFGGLLVFSPRAATTHNELNFLSLFANQIELAITIAELFEGVKKQAITDPLTNLYNRRYFEEALKKESERSDRLNQPFSIVSLDLDYLKKINDTHGHAFGDLAIKTIANTLKNNARSIDIPCRFGGEEFCLLLPGVDSYGAVIAAERLRAAIEKNKIETIGRITASVGVATYIEHTKNLDELLELADQAMYKAKINGRNRVQVVRAIDEFNWQEIAVKSFIDILSKRRVNIPQELSDELCEKLHKNYASTSTVKEVLFNISDTISQMYNKAHKNGFVKEKVKLANELAQKSELTKEEIDQLKIAILLYDIGNLNLPHEIFEKEGPLTKEEIKLIQNHPLLAAREILEPITNISPILPIIEHHHENWDGSGYPNKISQKDIPVSSQIILLIDAYFALLQSRPYRPALTKTEAIIEIQKLVNKKWSKDLVEKFMEIVQKY